ncbi:GNAT family N-acetyltransferase [Enterococcus massiliensis]|uniref:GNAT family N-acetyltransferase n=1 Tax=Enterococcus massiliensis TaxID=1640685 RepID=UPI00065DDD8D|nr:GNAT family N-acetyltransferase [Enterococcus massiliensis]
MTQIHFGNTPWLQATAFYLRYSVFVLEQNILPIDEFDQLDQSDRNYFIAMTKGKPSGTIRYQRKGKQLQPDRFCILNEFRHQGIGTQLIRACEDRGKSEGCSISRLSAETSAESFYKKLGYQRVSSPFFEDGILCVTMEKKL